jgi:hypothetical protein
MKDLNTGFFHRQAKWRARKNKIKKLKKTDGTFTEDPREMKDLSVAFFADLYKMDEGASPHQVLSLVEPREMQDMNLGLSNDFPEKEISDALFQTGPLKAPGHMVSW